MYSFTQAKVPDKKNTTTTELTMENQWICTSLIVRYVSQRDAHFTWLSYTPTEETQKHQECTGNMDILRTGLMADISPPSAQSRWRAHCSLWMDQSPGEQKHSPPVVCTYDLIQSSGLSEIYSLDFTYLSVWEKSKEKCA